jgi:hypothetical protein
MRQIDYSPKMIVTQVSPPASAGGENCEAEDGFRPGEVEDMTISCQLFTENKMPAPVMDRGGLTCISPHL